MKGIILVLGVIGLTGCVGSRPVSSTSVEKKTNDSSVVSTQRTDSTTYYRESVEKKILPGSSVEITATHRGLDSLIQAMKAMPASVSRTIYKTDPTMKTTLAIIMDSVGNIHFRAITAQSEYYEKTIEQLKIINSLKEENTQLRKVNESRQDKVVQQRKPFLQEVWQAAKWIVFALVAFFVCGVIFYIKSKFNLRGLVWKSPGKDTP